MTVTYTGSLHTVGWFSFFRLLLRWRGSFYKLILPQCLVFYAIYVFLLISYSFVLSDENRHYFEGMIVVFARSRQHLGDAVALFLGFFIYQIWQRFWAQFLTIPWPDGFAFLTSSHIVGRDKRSRLMRRTLVRYVCAANVIALSDLVPRIKQRFPTYNHYISSDLLTENEAKILASVQTEFNVYCMPLTWATSLLRRARKEGRIHDNYGYNALAEEIVKIRAQLGVLWATDYAPVPLVYVQICVLVVYAFFSVTVLTHPFEHFRFSSGEVFTFDSNDEADQLDRDTRMRMRFLFALITLITLSLYAGILHTSETLICPFGENDGDIDVDQLVDRHLRVSYLIVDEMYAVIPELTIDLNWCKPQEEITLPYTSKTAKLRHSASVRGKRGLKIVLGDV